MRATGYSGRAFYLSQLRPGHRAGAFFCLASLGTRQRASRRGVRIIASGVLPSGRRCKTSSKPAKSEGTRGGSAIPSVAISELFQPWRALQSAERRSGRIQSRRPKNTDRRAGDNAQNQAAFYRTIFNIMMTSERICRSARTVRGLIYNLPRPAISLPSPRLAACTIATSVEPPEQPACPSSRPVQPPPR